MRTTTLLTFTLWSLALVLSVGCTDEGQSCEITEGMWSYDPCGRGCYCADPVGEPVEIGEIGICRAKSDTAQNIETPDAPLRAEEGRRKGESCDFDHQCHSFLVCNPRGSCAQPAGPGELCDRDLQCSPDQGLVCHELAGECGRPQHDGGRCVRDVECVTPLFCNLVLRSCETPRNAGEPCDHDSMCASGLACPIPLDPSLARSCETAFGGAVGDACDSDIQCGVGLQCDVWPPRRCEPI